MPSMSSAEFHLVFGMRISENVRAKGCGVNSVFLVQLRKILDANFYEVEGIDNLAEDILQGACRAVIEQGESTRRKVRRSGGTGCPQKLHRKYRKAVGRDR